MGSHTRMRGTIRRFAQRRKSPMENQRAQDSRGPSSAHLKMRTKIKEMAGLMVLVCRPQAADIAELATSFRLSGETLRQFQPRS
jgi:hypothetical protein